MAGSFSRRNFLRATGLAGAAALWTPDLQARTFDEKSKEIGKSKWDLDTPALCVDLDKMESNIKGLESRLKGTGIATRPHAKTHKTPEIAKLQLASGSIGICTAKVSEAEVMFANGIQKIMMTTCNISQSKIKRAMDIQKKNPYFIQAVDNLQNAQDLSAAAKAMGITANVVVDVATATRTGVPPGQPALTLAQQIDKLPNLKLMGILAYDGGAQHIKGYQARHDQTLKRFEPMVETFNMMKASGLNMAIFSGGGTGTHDIMTKVPQLTDIQVGSYVFLDCQYLEIGSASNATVFDDFAPSLTVMTTILNTNWPGNLTTDAGTKALTLNKPDPIVIGEEGFRYTAGSDEFGAIKYEKSNKTYKVGDRLELIAPHCDPIVNEYSYMYGIRKGKVEKILTVSARGMSQ